MIRAALTVISAAAMLGLSACGFTPLHAPMTGNSSSFDRIGVEMAVDNKIGFLIEQSLKDRIGTATPEYRIVLSPELTRRSLGISADDVASRYDLRLSVGYKIKDAASGKVLDAGTVNAVSTFGAPLDPFGRTAAESDAETRLAREAADRVLIKAAKFINGKQ